MPSEPAKRLIFTPALQLTGLWNQGAISFGINVFLRSTISFGRYVLTTPVPFNGTLNDRVKQYNSIASHVMEEQPTVATADLYSWVVEACGDPPYLECIIARKQPSPHYTPQGYQYLSQRVKDLILDLTQGLRNEKGNAQRKFVQTEQDDSEPRKSLVRIDLSRILLLCRSLLRRGLFRLSDSLENWGNKARGSWREGKRKRAEDTFGPSLSLFFPRFLAVSPLKEPLRRRESLLRLLGIVL